LEIAFVATNAPRHDTINKGEIIMNPQDENQDTVQTAAYNPFPEPQTIPSGWDTSVFSAGQPAAGEPADEPVESESH
jgi:hypothetical protein